MASTAITFQALYGVHSDETAVSYLLEVDGVCILLDCGWDENFDVALLEPLKSVISRIDLVLLSQPDLAHLGALRPFLRLSPDGVETPLRFERTHTVLAQVGDGFRLLPMLPVASYCFRSLPICFRRFYSLLLASARF